MLPEVGDVARDILERCEASVLPIDLGRVAALWGKINVHYDDIEGSGYLIHLGRAGGEIIVRRSDPVERQRYTIAHELGHWILFSEYPQQAKGEPAVVERWCDRFASALLMPESILLGYLRIGGASGLAERVATGHRRFGVSQEAFRRRVTEATPVSVVEICRESGIVQVERKFCSQKVELRRSDAWIQEAVRVGVAGEVWPSFLDKGVARCSSVLLGRTESKELWLLCIFPRRKASHDTG